MTIPDARAGRIMVVRQHPDYFFGIFVQIIQSLSQYVLIGIQ